MDKDTMKKHDFSIYYLNFSKVYEMSMMINNVIISSVERTNEKRLESIYGYSSTLSAKGSKILLDGIKASISSESKETSFASSRVIENLDVKTTKSILLRRIIDKCNISDDLSKFKEGDLIKIDNVKLEIMDEDSLRQFLILRKDALKGFRVEGMEINNLISSMLQDYAYILIGTVNCNEPSSKYEIIIKIPLEIQNEFENKYSINDLLIGHVSIIGIYKGEIEESSITSNTFTYLQEIGTHQSLDEGKIFASDADKPVSIPSSTDDNKYHFIDVIAIIQDVNFDIKNIPRKKCWLKKLFAKKIKEENKEG